MQRYFNTITLVGIDPGVTTGIATLTLGEGSDAREYDLVSGTILEIMGALKEWAELGEVLLNYDERRVLLVVMEDARLRTWFGHSGPERWQGAGSIKRDCQIWEEFLKSNKIPYLLVPPMHNRTKMSAAELERHTGIRRSNQHERDAAALLLPYNYKTAMAAYEAKKIRQ